jgi:glutathione synthase/RimK-type ligase-like ATP-grasp enzyme
VILIVTSRGDLTADWLLLELAERGIAFTRLNTEDFPGRVCLAWRLGQPPVLEFPSGALELAPPLAVWYRRPLPPERRGDIPPDAARWAAHEAAAALGGTWRTLDALWVNHPDANAAASSKLGQLEAARRLGFDVPATLVSADADRVRAFAAEHAGGIVCKPVDGGDLKVDGSERLFYTSRVTEVSDLSDLGPEPYLFQELVHKRYDVRVTVIGDEAFATRIDSQTDARTRTDWRRMRSASLRHTAEPLPADVADRCRELLAGYGLRFAAIDLARDEDGRYRFFEINPNGQWAWIEQLTGTPLRAALADLLSGAAVAHA